MSIRDYELTLVADSQLAQDALDGLVSRYESLLSGGGAEEIRVNRRGVGKLAYEIRKHQQGNFVYIQFRGAPELVQELERQCRLDPALLRFMVVRMEEAIEPEEKGEEASAPEGQESEGSPTAEAGEETPEAGEATAEPAKEVEA